MSPLSSSANESRSLPRMIRSLVPSIIILLLPLLYYCHNYTFLLETGFSVNAFSSSLSSSSSPSSIKLPGHHTTQRTPVIGSTTSSLRHWRRTKRRKCHVILNVRYLEEEEDVIEDDENEVVLSSKVDGVNGDSSSTGMNDNGRSLINGDTYVKSTQTQTQTTAKKNGFSISTTTTNGSITTTTTATAATTTTTPSPPPVPPTSPKEYRKKRFANALGFLTGYSDVVALKQYQTFPTMMSGNTLKMAGGLVDGKFFLGGSLFYLLVITCYSIGLALFRHRLTSEDKELRQNSLKYCGTMVALTMTLSDVLHYECTAKHVTKMLSVGLLATSYGIINSIGSEVSGTMTFVVTGHITKVVHQMVDRFSKRRGYLKVDRSTMISNLSMIVSFFMGGFVGYTLLSPKFSMVRRIPHFAIIGLLHGLLFYMVDIELMGGAWWKRRQPKLLGTNLEDDGEITPLVEEVVLVNGTRLIWEEEEENNELLVQEEQEVLKISTTVNGDDLVTTEKE